MYKTTLLLYLSIVITALAGNRLPAWQLAQKQPQQINQRLRAGNQQRIQNNAFLPQPLQNQGRRNHSIPAQNGHMPISAAAIRKAVDRAVAYLQNCQAEDGSIEEQMVHYSEGAGTVMSALAMLAAGADPESDVSLRRALDWLVEHNAENTYYRAVRANVWEYALRRSPEDTELRQALGSDFQWLLAALNKKEGWRYLKTSSDWDNSVTQYGVLGIWAACRAGFSPEQEFWHRMSRHFRSCQNSDGGWGYQRGSSSHNMATAGLATMFLVFDMYHGRQHYRTNMENPFQGGEAAECLDAIGRGMNWLDQHPGGTGDGYYLYGIERTGVASGRKYIGGRDWFREGVASVLQHQKPDGSIPMSGYGKTRVNTGFATLFMVYGGAPVAFNKLEYGEHQEWNLNPRDIANVTKHLWKAYERPLNWFSVSIDAPVEEFEAPILYISGASSSAFSDEQVHRLRDYINRGGTIFAEPADHNAAFRKSMEELVTRLFPAKTYKGRALVTLPPSHPVYTVLKQEWDQAPTLRGASDGSRIVFFLSEDYLAKDWQMNHTHTDAFKLAMNVLFYTTDRGSLHGRFHSTLPDSNPAEAADWSLHVGRMTHEETTEQPSSWKIGESALPQFSSYFNHVHGGTLITTNGIDSAKAIPKQLDALVLSGNRSLTLSKKTVKALKAFVASGGTLIVDAYAGNETFARSARRAIEKHLGKLQPINTHHDIVTGRFPGGFDLSHGIRYTLPARKTIRTSGQRPDCQHLEVVTDEGRVTVIFSPFDITGAVSGARNFAAKGYTPTSARQVLSNIFGYITHQKERSISPAG